MAIDMANRSLLSDFLPIQTARALGLHLIGGIGPLRRLAMREGLAPSWRHVPRDAMRPILTGVERHSEGRMSRVREPGRGTAVNDQCGPIRQFCL